MRQQVDHGIGRAADRGVDPDGILEACAGQDLRHAQVLAHHLDDAPARHVGQHVAARIDGGNGGVAGQRHAQRLDHARHGGRGAHGHAVAGGAAHAGLGVDEICDCVILPARTSSLNLPDVGARADVLAAELAVEHRAARDDDGRQVAARRAHQQRGRGLVAAAQQHHAVDGVAADRFLDIHAGQIAEQHGGRPHHAFRPAT